jgi:hypothetical protein
VGDDESIEPEVPEDVALDVESVAVLMFELAALPLVVLGPVILEVVMGEVVLVDVLVKLLASVEVLDDVCPTAVVLEMV